MKTWLLYCQNAFEKIIKYAWIYFFFFVTHPSFNFLKHDFWVFYNCRLTVEDTWFTQNNPNDKHKERKSVCWSMFYLSSLHYNTFKTTHLKLYCSVVNVTSGSSLFLFTIYSPETAFYFILTYTPIF